MQISGTILPLKGNKLAQKDAGICGLSMSLPLHSRRRTKGVAIANQGAAGNNVYTSQAVLSQK